MTLSDGDIRRCAALGELTIVGLREGAIQPASVDMHLGSEDLLVWTRSAPYSIVPWVDQTHLMRKLAKVPRVELGEAAWTLPPGGFALASTAEHVALSDAIVGRIEGKSSVARLGLLVHVTAGFIDPGFCGHVTLELTNLTAHPMLLKPDMPIAQMCFERLSSPAEEPYQGKYQNQSAAPQPSRYYRNFEESDATPNNN